MSKHSSDHTKPSTSEKHENPSEMLEEMKMSMVTRAVRGDWSSFVEYYKQRPQVRMLALTQQQQTALHIAIASGEDVIAKQLIDILKEEIPVQPPEDIEGRRVLVEKDERGEDKIAEDLIDIVNEEELAGRQVLDQKDERGNTALHLAAAMGMTNVCKRIIRVSPQLIFNRNEKGETPIFLAASHGWAELFFCFHLKANALRTNDTDLGYCKRDDGNTILHCAIANDKFGLALMVLKLYPNLTTSCNSNGDTPLHILATKPTAFRSGKPLDMVGNLFYKCILVKNTHYDEDYAENLKELGETEMEEDKKGMELIKEKFAKLFQGEEMSSGEKSVSSDWAWALKGSPAGCLSTHSGSFISRVDKYLLEVYYV